MSWKITAHAPRDVVQAALVAHEDVWDWDPEIVIAGSEIAEDKPHDWKLEAWLPRRPTKQDKAAVAGLFAYGAPALGVEKLPDTDWLVASQSLTQPIRAGRFHVHTPDFPRWTSRGCATC